METAGEGIFYPFFLFVLDPCITQPCQNNGLCFHNGTHDKRCVCPVQFSGDKCEKGNV